MNTSFQDQFKLPILKLRKQIKSFPEELKEEALKYETRKQFRAENCSAHNTVSRKGLSDELCLHMPKAFNSEELQTEASKYNSRGEFENGNSEAYRIAWGRGLLDKICKHMNLNFFY